MAGANIIAALIICICGDIWLKRVLAAYDRRTDALSSRPKPRQTEGAG